MDPNFDLDLMCNDLGDLMEDDLDLSMEGLPAPAPKPPKAPKEPKAPTYRKPRSRTKDPQTRAQTYARARAEGRCIQCGQPARPGKVRCAVCTEQRRQYASTDRCKELRRARVAEWKSKGICVGCGCRAAVQGMVICEQCRARRNNNRQKQKANKP